MRHSLLVLIAIMLMAICQTFAFAQRLTITHDSNPPHTVLDYFLLLPNRYVEGTPKNERLNWLLPSSDSVIDNPHDYLHCAGDSGQMVMDVALFRYRGLVTVGVLDYGYDPQEPTLNFLRYERGQWRDATATVLPIKIKPSYFLKLPRYGTTIDIYNRRDLYSETGQLVYRLRWVNGKFQVVNRR